MSLTSRQRPPDAAGSFPIREKVGGVAKGRVTEKERKQIIEALRAGNSQTSVAKRFGRSTRTISRIAHAEGITSPYLPPKKANEARVRFAKAGRIEIIEAGLSKAYEMLGKLAKPGELQQWSMALAVLIDKRRQEDDDESGKRRGSISALMERLREGEDDAGTPER